MIMIQTKFIVNVADEVALNPRIAATEFALSNYKADSIIRIGKNERQKIPG